MDTATRVQILDDTVCVSHSTNSLGKGMNPIILPPATGKIVGQTRFFSLGDATSLGEEKLWIQTCYTSLKNWPCVLSCRNGGVGKYRLALDVVFCLELGNPLIFGCIWFLHIPFCSMVKFSYLEEFQMDHLSHPVVPSLVLFSF